MTLGDSWSYKPDDRYKSARAIVHTLVDIVAKGGNLLLNVGPDGKGRLPTEAISRLKDIGAWMKINGQAIYASRPIAPYSDGKLRFTHRRDGVVHAIWLADQDEVMPPERIAIRGLAPAAGAQLRLLGARTPLSWSRQGGTTIVTLPSAARRETAGACAWSIELPGAARAV